MLKPADDRLPEPGDERPVGEIVNELIEDGKAYARAEVNLYKRWLQQVAPGATPTFFGLFSWSATKLFVAESLSLGGKLTRSSLVARVKGIRNWTASGAHSPMDVGGKHAPSCVRFLQLRKGRWVPLKGTAYVCRGAGKA